MRGVHLLLIDPQNDFANQTDGSLAVPGADVDMERIAHFIETKVKFLDAVHVTLDSHQLWHIANPLYWMNDEGERPAPFTHITAADVEAGKWKPIYASKLDVLNYLRKLEASGRYEHTIWPPHCIVGEWGHGIHPGVARSIRKWAEASVDLCDDPFVDYVLKGGNSHTEHFSAIRAEVPNDDPQTHTNHKLIDKLENARSILVGGIAGSHCVANTVRDLVRALGGGSASKLVILTDTISPVPGCEKMQKDFIEELLDQGAAATTTDKWV